MIEFEIVRAVQYNNITKVKKKIERLQFCQNWSLSPISWRNVTRYRWHSMQRINTHTAIEWSQCSRQKDIRYLFVIVALMCGPSLAIETRPNFITFYGITNSMSNDDYRNFFFHMVVLVTTFIRNKKVKFQIGTDRISSIYYFRSKIF